tara:strand:- start:2249 stop:2482 length:234 start_codon:yes stop_codon:yes gene_type:complete
MSHEIPISINCELQLEVTYYLEGRYYPETLTSPAEHPELVIYSAVIEGTKFDLYPHLSWADEEALKESVGECLSDQT